MGPESCRPKKGDLNGVWILQAQEGGPKWGLRVLQALEGGPKWGLSVLQAERRLQRTVAKKKQTTEGKPNLRHLREHPAKSKGSGGRCEWRQGGKDGEQGGKKEGRKERKDQTT